MDKTNLKVETVACLIPQIQKKESFVEASSSFTETLGLKAYQERTSFCSNASSGVGSLPLSLSSSRGSDFDDEDLEEVCAYCNNSVLENSESEEHFDPSAKEIRLLTRFLETTN